MPKGVPRLFGDGNTLGLGTCAITGNSGVGGLVPLKHKPSLIEIQQQGVIHQLEEKIEILTYQLTTYQLAEEHKMKRTVATRTAVRSGDPFISNRDAGNLWYTPPCATTPIGNRHRRSFPHLDASALPYTPITNRTPIGRGVLSNSMNTGSMTGTTPSLGRRHKRTETPEQLFLRPYTQGIPIFTFGIDPQNDRGLLHDFFEDIRKWATLHTKDLTVHEISTYSGLSDIADMLTKKSNLEHMLADKEMRKDIVAALVTRHVVLYAMGEHFLYNSEHHAGEQCNDLFLQFAHLVEEEYSEKHEVCKKQMALYNNLKTEPDHKKWRTLKAEERYQDLMSKIDIFLEPGVHPEREHILSELYVKGYRIGFRLRMEAVKWQITWPTAGTDLNLNMMVNQTRNLFGDPMRTLNMLQEHPKSFMVRFALTPTFIKSDFSSGVEEKTVVHSSLVHMGRKGVFSHKHDAGQYETR